MRVTEEQRRHIDRLYCERLSSNDVNLRQVDEFFNRRNDSFSDTLQNEAYEEDLSGKVAYYVVKNDTGDILFYFSLKCGMLYDSFIDDRSLNLLRRLVTYLDDISVQSDLTEAVDVSTAKPIYDLTCKFMYQETDGLLSEREYFYSHYNVDSDEA